MVARMFRHLGHSATATADPAEALGPLLEFGDFDAVFSDYQMIPNGVAVLAAYEATQPWAFRALVTASPMTKALREAERTGIVQRLLTKPVSLSDLSAACEAARAAGRN